MKRQRPKTIRALKKAFEDNGMLISDSWIRRQEEKGNLFIQKSTTNFKRPQGIRRPGAVRQFTSEQIIGILIAFLPKDTKLTNGRIAKGNGYWHY